MEPRENGPKEKVLLRLMTVEDMDAIVEVHKLAFPDSFLTKLGPGAVSRYYRWQLEGPHSHYSIVAVFREKIVGLCVGGVSRGALSGFLKRYKLYLGLKVLSKFWLLMRGNFLKKSRVAMILLWRNLVPRGKELNRQAEPIRDEKPISFGILSICVTPDVRGLGIAQALMLESENEALKRSFGKMHLTVATVNARAIRFYQKLGYVIVKKEDASEGTYLEKWLRRE